MPAPHQCTLPTRCDRGCGPMRRCGLCRGNVHGGVVQVRAGGRAVAWLGRTAQKRASLRPCLTRTSGDQGVLTLNEGAIGRGPGLFTLVAKHRDHCAPPQDRARLPERHQTIPGGFDAFSS